MIGRREFITLVGGAAAWPMETQAQQPERMRRIGVLSNIGESDLEAQSMVAALHVGLRKLGWVNGRNLQIDHRWAAGSPERIVALAQDLLSLNPEAIVAHTTPSVAALRNQTDTVPIVFVQISDPIGSSFVASFARPGGNVTGFTNFESSMVGKWVEMLKEIAPGMSRVAYLFNPQTAPYVPRFYQVPLEEAARSIQVEPLARPVQSIGELENAIASLARDSSGGLIMMPDSFNIVHRDRIIALAAQQRLPTISPYRFAVVEGGLMSYGVEQIELFRQAASYVDRILKGTKPNELPVQAPTRFELVLNLKTAKMLGLAVPLPLLTRADEVIE